MKLYTYVTWQPRRSRESSIFHPCKKIYYFLQAELKLKMLKIADARLFKPPLSSLHPEEKGSLVTTPFIIEEFQKELQYEESLW